MREIMKRSLEQELKTWRDNPRRLPLILRGARQVGKSYLIQKFGKENFASFVEVNFEFQPELKSCFDTLDPIKIVAKLETYVKTAIEPGKTLLFLDEIQECPPAILALRYFKEKMASLHVISAGSLLEFALEEEEFSFPVGRVQFIYLYPLSFIEFLYALEEDRLIDLLPKTSLQNPLDNDLHEHLLKLVRYYFLTGGLPEAINSFLVKNSFLESRNTQLSLLQTYQKDFGKYASKTQHVYLQKFFTRAPAVVAQHFKYVNIDRDARPTDLKTALELLSKAGLITQVFHTSASGLPLRAQINEKKFKLIFLDIGLLQAAMGSEPHLVFEKDLLQLLSGVLAEQFVGQELLAYANVFEEKRLYFWEREKQTSSAEVDYVINLDGRIVPIEVKGGKGGHLKSLHQFLVEKNCPVGVRISSSPLMLENNILSIPFYLIRELPRLLQSIHFKTT
jgi:uncharacterized protein